MASDSHRVASIRAAIADSIHRPSATSLRSQRQTMRDSHTHALTPVQGPGRTAAREAHIGVLSASDANSQESLLHLASGQALAFEFLQRRQNAHAAEDTALALSLQREEEQRLHAEEEETHRLRMREAMGDSDFARSLSEEQPAGNDAHYSPSPALDPDLVSSLSDAELNSLLASGQFGALSSPAPPAPSPAPARPPPRPSPALADLAALSDEELAALLASGQLDELSLPSQASGSPGAKPWGFSGTSPCFSFVMHPDFSEQQLAEFDAGNRICLSKDIADRFDASGPEPVFLELVNPLLAFRQRYVGVLPVAPSLGQVYLPPPVLASLGLDEGQQLQLTRLHLPAAARVVFAPLHELGADARAAQLLRQRLASWSCLANGDVVIVDDGHGRQVEARVVSVEPESPAALLPLQRQFEVAIQPAASSPPPAEAPIAELALNVARAGRASAEQYSYYRLALPPLAPGQSLRIALDAESGDPDGYVSQVHERPSLLRHAWAANTTGGEVINVSSGHEQYQAGRPVYLAVIGFEGPTEYRILASVVEGDAQGGAQSGISPEAEVPAPAGFTKCYNCKHNIPSGNMIRHELICLRQHWTCPACRVVFLRSEQTSHAHCHLCQEVVHPVNLQKHLTLAHKPIPCVCGVSLPLQQLIQHQEHDCAHYKPKVASTLTQLPALAQIPVQSSAPPLAAIQPSASPAQASRPPPPARPSLPPVPSWRKTSVFICPYCDASVIHETSQSVEAHLSACPEAAAFTH